VTGWGEQNRCKEDLGAPHGECLQKIQHIVTPADVLDAMRSVEVSAAKALPEDEPKVSAKFVQKSGRKNSRRLRAVQSKSAGA
jgi:hypothetical protein